MVDGELQRPTLEEQQRCESVEESLQGVGQVAFLVSHETSWQRVVYEQPDRNMNHSLTHRLHHHRGERQLIRIGEFHCGEPRTHVIEKLRSWNVREGDSV